MTSKKWIIITVSTIVAMLVFLMAIAFVIDPFYHYRVSENKYMLNSRFVNSGVIHNYDYDTAIVGSSMIQNFNMGLLGETLDCNPIKLSIGGITTLEIVKLTELLQESGKAKNIFVCLDIATFASRSYTMRFPEYLIDDNPLNDFRYLLGYEAWMRYIPVDLGIMLIDKIGIEFPEKLVMSTQVDYLEYWNDDYQFGKDVVVNAFLNGNYAVSEVFLDDLYNRMAERFDEYISIYDDENTEYTFFFPPYSSLYWYNAKENGYFDTYISIKKYMVNTLSSKENFRIFDFQSMPSINNLDIYKDTTHYNKETNDSMVLHFASGEYEVSADNINASISKQEELLQAFIADNSDWLLS